MTKNYRAVKVTKTSFLGIKTTYYKIQFQKTRLWGLIKFSWQDQYFVGVGHLYDGWVDYQSLIVQVNVHHFSEDEIPLIKDILTILRNYPKIIIGIYQGNIIYMHPTTYKFFETGKEAIDYFKKYEHFVEESITPIDDEEI